MFCKNCGNQLADDAKFCNKCGTAMKPVETAVPVATSAEPEVPVAPVQPEVPFTPEVPIEPAAPYIPEKPAKKGLPWWAIVLIVLAGLIGAFGCFVLVDGLAADGKTFESIFGVNLFVTAEEEDDDNDAKEKDKGKSENENKVAISVPNFCGKTESDILENNPDDFKFKIEREYKEGIKPGVIFDQNPPAGANVKKYSEITVKVSLGDKSFTVPNLYNMPLEQAITAITGGGFSADNIEIVEQTDPYIEKGYVIDSDPLPGASVPASAKITLTVSSGPPVDPVKVPQNLLGAKFETAKGSLENVGLLVGEVTYEYNDTYPQGFVCAVSPDPTKTPEVERGTKIDIVISNGPEY